MPSVSSVSSAGPSGLQQLMQLQARRSADQAELTAQSLRRQANDAQRVADQANENARSLSVQSNQAQEKAGQARQGVSALNASKQAFAQVSKVVEQAVVREPVSTSTIPAISTVPVVNSQSQLTGTIINTTA